MYTKSKEKQLAILLRKEGMSFSEIAKKLQVSKGSISSWTKDLVLTVEQTEKLLKNNKNKYEIGFDKYRQKLSSEKNLRISGYLLQGKKLASEDNMFQIICSLYWGEGDKTSEYFKIANSDYTMLQLVWKWFCQNNYREKVKFSVLYHLENKISKEEILDWWIKKLSGVKLEQCASYVKNSTAKNKNIGKLPYGTGYLMVYSVELFYMVMGGIEFLRENL